MAVAVAGKITIDTDQVRNLAEELYEDAVEQTISIIERKLKRHLKAINEASSNRTSQLRALGVNFRIRNKVFSGRGTYDRPFRSAKVVVKRQGAQAEVFIQDATFGGKKGLWDYNESGANDKPAGKYQIFPQYEGNMSGRDPYNFGSVTILTRNRKRDGKRVALWARNVPWGREGNNSGFQGYDGRRYYDTIVNEAVNELALTQAKTKDGKFGHKIKKGEVKITVSAK